MMNKKITTYLLLSASILIWGTIAWRVIQTFKKEDPVVETTLPHPLVKKPDSVMLLLNYNDPFLKVHAVKSSQNGEDTEVEQESPEPDFLPQEPEVVQGPAFKFKGMLKAGKKSYGLLDLAGETIMVSPREKIGDFYVVSISPDKLVVRRQGLDMDLFAE